MFSRKSIFRTGGLYKHNQLPMKLNTLSTRPYRMNSISFKNTVKQIFTGTKKDFLMSKMDTLFGIKKQ